MRTQIYTCHFRDNLPTLISPYNHIYESQTRIPSSIMPLQTSSCRCNAVFKISPRSLKRLLFSSYEITFLWQTPIIFEVVHSLPCRCRRRYSFDMILTSITFDVIAESRFWQRSADQLTGTSNMRFLVISQVTGITAKKSISSSFCIKESFHSLPLIILRLSSVINRIVIQLNYHLNQDF